jgi:SAM-dependent methyltransferase
MSDPTQPAAYDEFYYRNCVGGDAYVRDRSWLAFNASIADRIVSEIAPRCVLDAGCGFGFLVEALRARGVEAAGIDVSPYAVQNIHESVREFCWSGSLTDDLPRTFDLIVTIEVLEHVPAADAERVIANLCAHAGEVLFSSTPFDRKELTHINVQPPEYWAEHFARHGFYRDVDFDASFITPWAVRFRKRTDPVHRIVRDYERQFAALQIERNEIRKRALEIQTELAHARAPLTAKAWRFVRRAGGRLLRPFRG